VCLIVRFRVSALLCLLALALSCSFVAAQIRLAAPEPASTKAHPDAGQTATNIVLDLCVDGSTTYPCPTPVIDDTKYIPAITLTYGQILDGVVRASTTTGTISIYRTGQTAPICVLQIGVDTTCPAASTIFDAGDYTLTATLTFPAGSTFADSTSEPVMVSVLQDTSSIRIKSSQNPAPEGTPVTFTATVLGSYGEAADGQVAISVDGGASVAYTLDGTGAAGFTTSTLAIGTHQIVASYAGSIDFDAAPDQSFTETIVPPGTATTLTSSLNPSALGQNVTFTATVTSVAAGVHPAGAVNFNDGTKTFATVMVSVQGIASASISTLTSGTHNITANYLGDGLTGPSSAALVQVVNFPLTEAAPGFTVTVTPSPVVLGVGLTANLTVTVTPKSGFSEPVTLTCGSLPHESTCTFGQSVIPAGGGTTTLDLYVTSPHDCGSTNPYFYGANRPGPKMLRYGGPALAGVLLLLLPRRRRRRGLLVLCATVSLAGLSGCSSACTDFGTYPVSYTFQVIGTAPAATSGASAGSETPLVVATSVGLTVKI